MKFEIATVLSAPRQAVWDRIGTFSGVNDELRPIVRMTYEARYEQLRTIPVNGAPVRSVLLLFGILPIDWHWLGFEGLEPGRGFRERSSSLLMRTWVHERTLESIGDDCRITDRLEFETRLMGLDRLLAPVYRATFRHRHARLVARFGRSESADGTGISQDG